jgi:hypothetical protein
VRHAAACALICASLALGGCQLQLSGSPQQSVPSVAIEQSQRSEPTQSAPGKAPPAGKTAPAPAAKGAPKPLEAAKIVRCQALRAELESLLAKHKQDFATRRAELERLTDQKRALEAEKRALEAEAREAFAGGADEAKKRELRRRFEGLRARHEALAGRFKALFADPAQKLGPEAKRKIARAKRLCLPLLAKLDQAKAKPGA